MPRLPEPTSDACVHMQVAVRTSRGGVERAWDCVYMQNNRKARHTDNPEETFETGNETTTKLTISYDCLCRSRAHANRAVREAISPTQRHFGPEACTGPCPAFWCGEPGGTTASRPRPQCVGCDKQHDCTVNRGNPLEHHTVRTRVP